MTYNVSSGTLNTTTIPYGRKRPNNESGIKKKTVIGMAMLQSFGIIIVDEFLAYKLHIY